MKTNNITEPDFWIEKWHALNARSTAFQGYGAARTWNSMAAGYKKTDDNEAGKKSADIAETLAFLEQKGVSFNGSRVLDIGCGPGHHAFAFAEKGAEVVCIDIAKNMINRLRAEIPDHLQNRISPLLTDWHTLDLEEHGFGRAFDLIFANMTPAVTGPETFLKLMEAGRQWCWFRSWAGKRENPFLEDLHRELFTKESDPFTGNFIIAFNLVCALGYYPACSFYPIGWTKKIVVSEAIDFYSTFFQSGCEMPPDELRKRITRYLEKKAHDGYIEYTVRGHTGMMLWNTSKYL